MSQHALWMEYRTIRNAWIARLAYSTYYVFPDHCWDTMPQGYLAVALAVVPTI
jgi:hypothetical protein